MRILSTLQATILLALILVSFATQAQRLGGIPDPEFNPLDSGRSFNTAKYVKKADFRVAPEGYLLGFVYWGKQAYYDYVLRPQTRSSFGNLVQLSTGAPGSLNRVYQSDNEGDFVRNVISDGHRNYKVYVDPFHTGGGDQFSFLEIDSIGQSRYPYSYQEYSGLNYSHNTTFPFGQGHYRLGITSPAKGTVFFWTTSNPDTLINQEHTAVRITRSKLNQLPYWRLLDSLSAVGSYTPSVNHFAIFGRYRTIGMSNYGVSQVVIMDSTLRSRTRRNLQGWAIAGNENLFIRQTKGSKVLVAGYLDVGAGPAYRAIRLNSDYSVDASFATATLPVTAKAPAWHFSEDSVLRVAWVDSATAMTAAGWATVGQNGGLQSQGQWVNSHPVRLDKVQCYEPAHDRWLFETKEILPAFATAFRYSFLVPDLIDAESYQDATCMRFWVTTQGQIEHLQAQSGVISRNGYDAANLQTHKFSNRILLYGGITGYNNFVSPGAVVVRPDGQIDTSYHGVLSYPEPLKRRILRTPEMMAHTLVGGKKLVITPSTIHYLNLAPADSVFDDLAVRVNFHGQPDAAQSYRATGPLMPLRNGGFAAISYFDPTSGAPVPAGRTLWQTGIRVQWLDSLANPVGTAIQFVPTQQYGNSYFPLRYGLCEDNAGGVWVANETGYYGGYFVRFAQGLAPKIIVPDSLAWLTANKNFFNRYYYYSRDRHPVRAIDVVSGVGYRLVGNFERFSVTEANELIMDTAGHLVVNPALNSPRKWLVTNRYGGRNNIRLQVHSRLPDNKYLVILGYGVITRYLSDGRPDPSFIPTFNGSSNFGRPSNSISGSWMDEAYRIAPLGDKIYYSTTSSIKANGDNYYTGLYNFTDKLNKTGLFCFQLRSVPGDYAFAQGRVSLVTAPQTGCNPAGPQRGIANHILTAAPGNTLAITDTAGYYSMPLPQGSYELRQPMQGNALMRQVCPDGTQPNIPINLTSAGQVAAGNTFINQTYDCPRLWLGQISPRFRMCSRGQILLNYGNDGTSAEPNARVRLLLPGSVKVLSSSRAFSRGSDSSYVFTIGNLAPGQHGQILILDTVACWGTIDSASRACFSARMEPLNVCGQLNPSQIGWSGAWLDAKAQYEDVAGGRIRAVIYARGAQMTDSVSYTVSGQNWQRRKLLLAPGDSLVLYSPFTGNSLQFYFSLSQPSQCPLGDQGWLSLIGKGGAPVWMDFANGWFDGQTIQACPQYRYSYDPNEKGVLPEGEVPNEAQLTYTIHFENQGNDSAFVVAVEDTLPNGLDVTSLKLVGSSHPCTVMIDGTEERPVATFLFNPIHLPARKQDSIRCQGQVSFQIGMKPGLPYSTRLANRAHIYFDQNKPVMTNTVINRLPAAPLAVHGPAAGSRSLKAWPNPSLGSLTVALPTGARASDLRVQTVQGGRIRAIISGTGSHMHVSGLLPGVYLLTVPGTSPVTVVVMP